MKCDELKRHHINEVMDMHNLTRGEMGYSVVYYAEDVDAAIAELKQKLDDVQARVYANDIDAWKRERRLRRALWLARAEMARTSAWVFWNRKNDYNYNKWKNVERKCRAKAEEYK